MNDRENKKLWVSGGSRSGDHVEAEEKSVVEKSRRHVVINGTGVNMGCGEKMVGGRTKQNTVMEGKGWRKRGIFIWVSKEGRTWRWGKMGTGHCEDTMSLCHEERMVQWMGMEHDTYGMEWKAEILGAYEGSKCLHLVYRSCSVQHSTCLCSLFGTFFVSVSCLCTQNLGYFLVSEQ